MPYRNAWRIANLLNPVTNALAWLCPGISDAVVSVVHGSQGLDAWKRDDGWTLKVGPLWLEVYRA